MITAIRRQLKGSTYRLVLLFIVFAIVLSMVLLPTLIRRSGAGGPWAIRINNQEIAYQEFMREVSEQRDRLAAFRAQYGQFADLLLQSMGFSIDPKALAFDVLVKEELINQLADQIGLYLHADIITQNIYDQEFVRQHLADVVPPFVFDQSGNLNMQALSNYLKRRGFSVRAFERKVERILARQQIMEIVASTSYIPEFDMKQQFIADNLRKKFSILTFSFDEFLKKEREKDISNEVLKAFFEKQNKQFKRYWISEKRAGVVWKFDPQRYSITISDDAIKAYYDDYKVKKFIDEPTKVHVRIMREKELADEDLSLEMVHEKLIADPTFMEQAWKELDPFVRGQQDHAIERAAFLLKKENDVSSVIETNDGRVIVKLIKRLSRKYKPLSLVQDEIKTVLLQKKFKEQFVQDMKDVVQENGKALMSIIAKKGGKQEQIASMERDNSRLAQHLFKIKKKEFAFYVDNNTGIAVQLTEIEERHLPLLESIQDVVKGDLYEEHATNALQSTLKSARQEASRQSFDELQKKFGGSLESTNWLSGKETKSVEVLEKRGVPVTSMLELEKVDLVLAHETDHDAYLIHLDEIEPFDKEDFDSTLDEVKRKLYGMRTRLHMEGFVASLYRNATIETNESIIMPDEEYSV